MSSDELHNAWQNGYLSDGNMAYVDALYEDFLANPNQVSPEWQRLFQGISGAAPDRSHAAIREYFLQQAGHSRPVLMAADEKQARVTDLINAYRAFGHFAAQLDPLRMSAHMPAPMLSLAYHQLDEADLNRHFVAGNTLAPHPMPLADILDSVKATYCGSIGIEYMHCVHAEEIAWFQQQLEPVRGRPVYDANTKQQILSDLIATDGLERYLATRYVGQKRFSLEGGDAFVPMLKSIIRLAGQSDVKEIVIGMAHRGRLNVLVNVLGKAPAELFKEFEGKVELERTGDVKYHLGFSTDVPTPSGAVVHVALAFNPSHLEIIAPVVEGSARSRLRARDDLAHKNSVIPVIVHGDAAFAGQGVVMETFNFSEAPGYSTGGSIHIVINNQIGFTTSNPEDARSSWYCTDVAKMVHAPILHVNGEDPEAVVFATQLAVEFRMRFKRDVVIDLWCYRRNGHNEADDPSVTQPLMYQCIKTMRPLRETYAEQLIADGLTTLDAVKQSMDTYRDTLDAGSPVVETLHVAYAGQRVVDWSVYLAAQWTDAVDTGVSLARLQELSQQLQVLPDNFSVHPVVKRLLAERDEMSTEALTANWGYAETLAYASLLQEGHNVRLSGQDAGRGTFAHRHAVLHDQRTGALFTPLQHVAPPQSFEVIDSVLSEEAVLAFEYGYASSEPTSLVLWEAQFGDFVNGAQVVIDQFISSGEQKWGRLCGLVMLLPHGYEGQGPEHSSARLERFMQLCAQQNIQVCTPTTPAQMFHLLRRQVLRPFRKPLIIMTPKSLLRHKLAVSTLDELSHGGFDVVIPEIDALEASAVTKVVLCCGKVYYDLLQKRRERELSHVAIVRIEQLYPFPTQALTGALAPYTQAKCVVWCQEEPQNQGIWFASQHHIQVCLRADQVLQYAGREFAAAPAVGSFALHTEQQHALVEQALMC